MVNYKAEVEKAVIQAERYQKLEIINNNVNTFSKIFSENVNVIKECAKAYGERNKIIFDRNQTLSQLNEIKNSGNSILNKLKEFRDKTDWNLENLYEDNLELLKIVDELLDKHRLLEAIEEGNEDLVKSLIDSGADLHYINN